MEAIKEFLLGLDTLILVILILGVFVVWELKSGEIPMRWFGAIYRDQRPFFIGLHCCSILQYYFFWCMYGQQV